MYYTQEYASTVPAYSNICVQLQICHVCAVQIDKNYVANQQTEKIQPNIAKPLLRPILLCISRDTYEHCTAARNKIRVFPAELIFWYDKIMLGTFLREAVKLPHCIYTHDSG